MRNRLLVSKGKITDPLSGQAKLVPPQPPSQVPS